MYSHVGSSIKSYVLHVMSFIFLSSEQGDVWIMANVDVYPVPSTLLIRGVRGGTQRGHPWGDIAIDDVTVLDTLCDGTLPQDETTTEPTTTTTPTTSKRNYIDAPPPL